MKFSYMLLSPQDLMTAIFYIQVLLYLTSTNYRWSRMQQPECSLALKRESTSHQSWLSCTGSLSNLELILRFYSLFLKLLMAQPPHYIAEILSPHSTSRSTRSSTKQLLSVPRTRLKTKGDRAFSVAGPNLWNPLPPHIKSSTTLASFKSNLKTYLFTLAFNNP